MESFFKLNVDQRDKIGNAAARSLRRSGKIPVNYYYQGEANQNMYIDKKVLHKAIQSGQHVFEMELDGNTIYVTIKEAQYHPVTEEIIHIDLLRVRRDVKMKFSIPLNLVGDAIGVVEGGIVCQDESSIELECFFATVRLNPSIPTYPFSTMYFIKLSSISKVNIAEFSYSTILSILITASTWPCKKCPPIRVV